MAKNSYSSGLGKSKQSPNLQKHPSLLKMSMRQGSNLSTSKLKKRTANVYEKYQKTQGDLHGNAALRSRLLGLRRALAKQTLGGSFNNLSKDERHAKLRKKLGGAYSDLYPTTPKTKKFSPPNNQLR